ARLVGDAERLFGGTQLRLMEALCGNLGARRQGRKRDEVGDELQLALERRTRLNASPGKRWIRRKALSDSFGIGDGELIVRRLQTAIVEQRDLDRRVGGEGAAEQVPNGGAGRLGFLGRADGGRVLVELLLGDRRNDSHACIGREPGASRKEGEPRQNGQ